MFPRLLPLSATLIVAVSIAGCCTTPRREVAYVAPPPAVPAPCNRCAPAPVPVVPVQPAPVGVVAPVPAVPPGAVYAPPAAAPPQPGAPPTAVVQGSYTPDLPAQPTPVTQQPIVRLSPPELSVPASPQTAEPPIATNPLPAGEQRNSPPATPIDIPGFKSVRDKVATGQQPFPDGVAWLQSRGYRTVLHLRTPGTDDTAARRQFEKHGLRYFALDVDARTLSKQTVDSFNRFVTDPANQPLFVYDADGSVSGGLWYLHYRLVEGWSNEKAVSEAERLGFRSEQDDNHRTMWIAVQKLLEANGR